MERAGIVENLQKVMRKEGKRISTNDVIRKSIQLVEKLESTGAIEKPKYRLPLLDTIGRTAHKTKVTS